MVPQTIVSDRDSVFMSSFWQEMFRLMGTKLRMSSAYHPQFDGQTEVLNRCVETYLRCFCSEQLRIWAKYITRAEYWYNSSYHVSANTTPFQVVYGRSPPSLVHFIPGECRVRALSNKLQDRDEVIRQLKYHLERAQQRMTKVANAHRREVIFKVGDLVFLKIRPHRQQTLSYRVHSKLSSRYYGPFEILQRVGTVAYRLKLPEDSCIHPVFHVSQLKPAVGRHPPTTTLPPALNAPTPYDFEPAAILATQMMQQGSTTIPQLLVQWQGHSLDGQSRFCAPVSFLPP